MSAATAVTDPEDQAIVQEERRTVLAALATLPAEQRAALVLVDMEGYPVADAARMLDCAVGTVKSRCSRGRARLAELLGLPGTGGDAEHDAAGNPTPSQPVPPRRGGATPWPTAPPTTPPTS